MKIVAVHFDYHGCDSFGRLLNVFCKSIQRNWPEVGLEIIALGCPGDKSSGHSFKSNTDKMNVWAEIVQSADEDLILMDCDMLVRAPFGEVFDLDADIVLTARHNSRYLYNGGVVFVRNTQAAKDFIALWAKVNADFLEDREKFDNKGMHEKWRKKYAGINQASLGCILETHKFKAKIKTVPCDVYNVCEDYRVVKPGDTKAKVVHYKSSLRKLVIASLGVDKCRQDMKQAALEWWAIEGTVIRQEKIYEDHRDKTVMVEKPELFTEFLYRKKVQDRNPLITVTSDKIGIRQYIDELGLSEILSEIDHVANDPCKIPLGPGAYAVKMNNGSGRNLFNFATNPVKKSDVIKLWNDSHGKTYGQKNGEWGYRGIEPQIYRENLLIDGDRWAKSYHMDCFGGEPELVTVYDYQPGAPVVRTGKPVSVSVTVYDKTWKMLPETFSGKPQTKEPKPVFLVQLFSYARKLAAPFDYVRVDFLELDGRLVFSEMTHYSMSGNRKKIPYGLDVLMGKLWEAVQ